MLIEGSMIRDYRILKLLGEGGMGKVYLADDLILNRKVAVKVLNPILTTESQFKARFIQEARVQARLIHQNIVVLYTFFEETQTYYMILEFAMGITLKELIRKTGPIPATRTLKIFSQVLEGIEYAHSKGIVHRDIKPGNIMVDERDRIKIMDFGIANILGEKGLTKTGMKLGTLYYMSPEQVNGEKVDERSDVYSLGMTLFEMLAGKHPFEKEEDTSEYKIMKKIVSEQLPDPRKYYPSIPEWLVRLMFRALEKSREHRVQSAGEFRSKLNPEDIDDRDKVEDEKKRENSKVHDQKSGTALERTAVEQIRVRKEKFEKPEIAEPEVKYEESKKNEVKIGKKRSIKKLISLVVLLLIFIMFWYNYQKQNGREIDWYNYQKQNGREIEKNIEPPVKIINYPKIDMVKINPGSFFMGSPESEFGRYDNEIKHKVTLTKSFYIGKYEVTQGQWKSVMGSNPSYFSGCGDDCPVESVTWFDAVKFCNKLSEMEGKTKAYTINGQDVTWNKSANGYRLPTEAEWEYACRAGSTSAFYNGAITNTEEYPNCDKIAWYEYNSGSTTHAVGGKTPNAWGLYDMSGNVYEWCWDWYGSYSGSETDPVGSASGSFRVLRGGSWNRNAQNCRSANRSHYYPEHRNDNIGFRLVFVP